MWQGFSDHMNVVIIGAGGGIGRAMIENLSGQSQIKKIYAVTHRSKIEKTDKIIPLTCDIIDETQIKEMCAAIDGPLDLILMTTGMLHDDKTKPEKSLSDINIDNLEKLFRINCFGPALVVKHICPLLNRDHKSVFAALSARVGSISDNHLGGWYSYRASKAALNMILKTTSIEVARKNKNAAVIGLHPGTVDTRLSKPFQANVPDGKLFTPEYAAEQMLNVVKNVKPDDSGRLFAYDGEIIEF